MKTKINNPEKGIAQTTRIELLLTEFDYKIEPCETIPAGLNMLLLRTFEKFTGRPVAHINAKY